MTAFPLLFTPLPLRHRTLRNRVTFGPHPTGLADDTGGGASQAAYYAERAIGGAAMIVVEPAPADDAVIGASRPLTEACHQAGDVTVLRQLVAASDHPTTEIQIDDAIATFVAAARRAQRAGFDGVEVSARHHGLIARFWSPVDNDRSDRWGGPVENRARLSRSILERIRATCGDDFVIGLAVSIDLDGSSPEELGPVLELLAWHDQRQLMDYLTYDAPRLASAPVDPEGPPSVAAGLREVVTQARLQVGGGLRTAAQTERMLATGHSDLVSLVRAQIADAHWVAKARQDRAEETRPCIDCHDGCRPAQAQALTCLVNPGAGRELAWGVEPVEPADDPKRVVVIGGGVAGLEVARVAAEAGHGVRLHDTAPRLGGQWRLAGRQPGRHALADHLGWYERELERLGVDVQLGVAFRLSSSLWEQALVVATGAGPARAGYQRALPGVARLPGVDSGHAPDVTDVLAGTVAPSGQVLVLDDVGDWRGIGTALYLQQLGCRVGLVTASPVVAWRLVLSGAEGGARRRFAAAGGVELADTVVTAWDGIRGTATLLHQLTGRIDEVGADWLVLSEVPVANDANDTLSATLRRSCPQAAVHVVGDATGSRQAGQAIRDARAVAQLL